MNDVTAAAEEYLRVRGLGVRCEDFYAYMPQHSYIFIPTREFWPAASVNARCAAPTNADGSRVMKPVAKHKKGGATEWVEMPMSPTEFLDERRACEQMTWAPGEAELIADRLVAGGGWVRKAGVNCFNLYLPPTQIEGEARKARPWLRHLLKVFPADARHIVRWLAFKVQHPGTKINHALVLTGAQRIGKDTILEPVKHAVGPRNFEEVSPKQLVGRFNGFLKSVILRVSEAHDLGELDRFGFYECLKTLEAAPPDVLRCDEKNLREHPVMNVTGVVITTNDRTGGVYLPPDDHRHYVAASDLTSGDFPPEYWPRLWGWYERGGIGHVVSYLRQLDLRNFNPKAPPPKTAAWWEIVDANRAPEEAELADVLEGLGNPAAVTKGDMVAMANEQFSDTAEWLRERKNNRLLPHRMKEVGYVPCRNAADQRNGLWKVNGTRTAIYVRRELSLADGIRAARALVERHRTADERWVKEVGGGEVGDLDGEGGGGR